MNLLPSTGIDIDAEIVDVNQSVHKTGKAKGLLRIEISVTPPQLIKAISAYSSHYGVLLNPNSYSNLPKKKSARVRITLIFGEDEYQAQLKTPESVLKQLTSRKPLRTGNRGPWIPSGPVMDRYGNDVKLAGALKKAGFPLSHWTLTQKAMSTTLSKPKTVTLLTVKFLIKGKTWTLLSPSGLTQSGGPPTPKPYR